MDTAVTSSKAVQQLPSLETLELGNPGLVKLECLSGSGICGKPSLETGKQLDVIPKMWL
jgi:hypothetical protein